MLKFLFDLATDPLGLPIHALWEYIILSGIGAVAFSVGWDVSPGGPFGSLIHWVVRLAVFVILWAIVYALIAAIQWIICNWVVTIAIIVVALLVIGAIVLRNK